MQHRRRVHRTTTKTGLVAVENLMSVFIEGRIPPNRLNPEVFSEAPLWGRTWNRSEPRRFSVTGHEVLLCSNQSGATELSFGLMALPILRVLGNYGGEYRCRTDAERKIP